MTNKRTLIKFVLDRTGSMSTVQDETVAGFNEYIKTLREDKNEKSMTLSLMQFDTDGIDTLYEDAKLKDVKDLTRETYQPRAMTNLYDAVGRGIRELEKKLSKSRAKNKPAVIFVVMTDGQENSSTKYTQKSIFDLIKEKTGEGWVFTYLSSDADAWDASRAMGMMAANTIQYDSAQTQDAFRGAAMATTSYAHAAVTGTASLMADKVMAGHDFGDKATSPADIPEPPSVLAARAKARAKAKTTDVLR